MKNVLVVGGLGHVGLPLSCILSKYHNVFVHDTNDTAIREFRDNKKAVFHEPGLNELIDQTADKIHVLDNCNSSLEKFDYIIITIGTPIDEFLNPKLKDIFGLIDNLLPVLSDNNTIILRSTLYPGITKKIETKLRQNGLKTKVAFCPERVAEGKMLKELVELPQIVAANDIESLNSASNLFSTFCEKIKPLNNTTAGELSKLFTNTYRYIHFAIANQFYMLSDDFGIDFYDVYDAIVDDYSRMKDFPKPGFTGGYCLRKDTLQLSSWNNSFKLGHEAALVNEYLPLHIFRKVRKQYKDISKITIGILGMAFKGNTDDTRDSLAFRLKNVIENECKQVLCSDEYIKRPDFITKEELLEKSDLIIIGANHDAYKNIKVNKPLIDVLNFCKEKV